MRSSALAREWSLPKDFEVRLCSKFIAWPRAAKVDCAGPANMAPVPGLCTAFAGLARIQPEIDILPPYNFIQFTRSLTNMEITCEDQHFCYRKRLDYFR